jgi:hypothetical protein
LHPPLTYGLYFKMLFANSQNCGGFYVKCQDMKIL